MIVSLMVAIGACGPMAATPVETGFLNRTLATPTGLMPYMVYVPRDYDADKKWPVILFLHGAGERGTDGLRQSEVGLGSAIRKHASWFPCIAVMPQCPNETWWNEPLLEQASQCLDRILAEFSCDKDRVYLTGLSMGGYGTWKLGAMYPDKFAALIVVCGKKWPGVADKLTKLPIWAFHGDADPVVPVTDSRELVAEIKAAGSNSIKLTEYPKVQHNSWDATYNNDTVIKWLLAQKRGQSPTTQPGLF